MLFVTLTYQARPLSGAELVHGYYTPTLSGGSDQWPGRRKSGQPPNPQSLLLAHLELQVVWRISHPQFPPLENNQ